MASIQFGEAFVAIRASLEQFDRDLRNAESKIKRSLSGVADKAERIGRRMTFALTLPLVGFAALAVKTASDVQELNNLIQETFGDSSDAMRDWAKETAKATKRSRFDLLKFAGDFAAFLKPLGVAPEQIVPISQALTQLVTDVSSFRNIAEERVFTAFFSGLAGETEAVRRLGIDIGQAALEGELLRLGIKGGADEATQAQKVIARYNLILAQTTDAQGDAVRTSDSFENQMRGLQASLKDLAVSIGVVLLPFATKLVNITNDLIQRFNQLDPAVQKAIVGATVLAAVVGPLVLAFGLLGRVILGLVAILRAPIVLIVGIGAAAAGAAIFLTELAKAGGDVGIAWQRTKDALADLAKTAGEVLVSALNSMFGPIDKAIGATEKFEGAGSELAQVMKQVKDAISGVGSESGTNAKEIKKVKDEIERLAFEAAAAESVLRELKFGDPESLAAVRREIELENAAIQLNLDLQSERGQRFAEAFRKLHEEQRTVEDVERIINGTKTEQQRLNEELERLQQLEPHLPVDAYRQALEQLKEKLGQVKGEIIITTQEIIEFSKQTSKSFLDTFSRAIIEGKSLFESFRDAVFDVLDAIRRKAIDVLVDALFAPLEQAAKGGAAGGAGGGGLIGGLVSFVGSIFGRFLKLQEGGSLLRGQPAVVGEAGPEVFMPNVAGRVIPHDEAFGERVTILQDIKIAGLNQQMKMLVREELARSREEILVAIADRARSGSPFRDSFQ